MRRLLFLVSGLFLFAVLLSSCKRDWTCQCVPTQGSLANVEHHPIEKKTHGEAKVACKELSNEEFECELR